MRGRVYDTVSREVGYIDERGDIYYHNYVPDVVDEYQKIGHVNDKGEVFGFRDNEYRPVGSIDSRGNISVGGLKMGYIKRSGEAYYRGRYVGRVERGGTLIFGQVPLIHAGAAALVLLF